MKKNQLLCLALAALLALCCVSALAESAAAPVCQQPTKDGKLHGHWYGEWFPTRVKHHTAFCRYDGCGEERETSCERITLSAGEATTAKLCPVCGGVDGVRGFAAVAAQVTGVDRALPQGEAIVRAGEWNGQQYLTVAFEYGGRLPAGRHPRDAACRYGRRLHHRGRAERAGYRLRGRHCEL